MSNKSISDISDDIQAIRDNKATLIGEGEWVKDSAYRVYQLGDLYIAIVVASNQDLWLVDETAEYISKEDISKYIGE